MFGITEGSEVYDFWFGSNWGNGFVLKINEEKAIVEFPMKGKVTYNKVGVGKYLRLSKNIEQE